MGARRSSPKVLGLGFKKAMLAVIRSGFKRVSSFKKGFRASSIRSPKLKQGDMGQQQHVGSPTTPVRSFALPSQARTRRAGSMNAISVDVVSCRAYLENHAASCGLVSRVIST